MTPLELASSLMGDSFATAMAIGGLVGSLCLRVVAGKYEKERRAWWDDFRRVAEGASRDMKVRFTPLCPLRLSCDSFDLRFPYSLFGTD